MKNNKRTLLAIVLMAMSSIAFAGLPVQDSQGEPLPTLAPMLEQVTPAVVNIATQTRISVQDNPLLRDPFFRFFFRVPNQQPQERSRQSLGSGVIIDAKDGYIITNNHVIDKADTISVTLSDGRTVEAKLVGTDPEADVAVIKIPPDHLTAMTMADSDRLRVGDFVVAIGNPFGLGQTVTSGIVSALGRSGLGIEGYEDFIQTDASINPGNSGGALVDLKGRLIGMNTAIIAPGGGNVGIGFAIPVNMIEKIVKQLIEYGEVKRGRLGIAAQQLTDELARAFDIPRDSQGAVITQIVNGSPAEKAGLEVGDIITEINGSQVRDVADVRNILGLIRINERVKLTVLRNGKQHSVTAVIAAPKQVRMKGEEISPRLAGAVFAINEDPELAGQHVEGIVVLQVEAGSAAWQTNLRKGDIILSINKRRVSSFDDMKKAIALSKRGILMNIQRGNMALFILVQ